MTPRTWPLVTIGLILGIATVGCDRSPSADAQSPQSETSDEGASTSGPDTVTFAFQPQANPQALAPDADEMAKYMSEQIGVEVEVFLPTSYAAVVEALRSKNADVAYFGGWPYLIAHQKAGAELLAAEERNGNPYYYSRWYVQKDSDIESVADLEGRAVAFTAPTSASGYLFPLAKFIEKTSMETGDDPKDYFSEVIYGGGYQQSLQALLNGRVDATAVSGYAPEIYLSDEELESLRVLAKQGPVPTHGVAVRSALPDELKTNIKEAFLSLNDSEHQELLTSLYGAKRLVERSHDAHVKSLADALETVGAEQDIEGFGAGSGSARGSGSGAAHGSGEQANDEKGSGEGSGQGSGKGSGHAQGSGEGSGSGPGSGAE